MTAKFPDGQRVMSPDGPARVLHEEGAGMRTLDMSNADPDDLAITREHAHQLSQTLKPGETTTPEDTPEEVREAWKRIYESARPAVELDGLVEVELEQVVGPLSIRHYKPDELTIL